MIVLTSLYVLSKQYSARSQAFFKNLFFLLSKNVLGFSTNAAILLEVLSKGNVCLTNQMNNPFGHYVKMNVTCL